MTIIWGLLCLGLIILIHEAGHYLAARASGVRVESFSLGMGPVLLHKKIGQTDYRISLLPLGGYCGMKGEGDFSKALAENLSSIPAEADSFYGVSPIKRIFIAFAGPLANLIFAFIAFSAVSMISYTYYSADNRVIMADELYEGVASAAHEAGMQSGDRIVSINGKPVTDFSAIVQLVSLHPEENLAIQVERGDSILDLSVTSDLDPSTGGGKIGVVSWVDPIIASIDESGRAYEAGLRKGDLITSINGKPIRNTAEIGLIAENENSFSIGLRRVDEAGNAQDLSCNYESGTSDSAVLDGVFFSVPERKSESLSFFPSLARGLRETASMLEATVKGILMLFRGTDPIQAVSGPARITLMLGDTVKNGFAAGIAEGTVSILQFLSLISISLFIMNLLPIPVLDGGLILINLVELITRRSVKPRALYRIQLAGIALVALLFCFALFSDVRFFFTSFTGGSNVP